MKVLVINAGSSSLKYQLIDMENELVLAKGNCERIGIEGGKISHKTFDGRAYTADVEFPTHTEAFMKLTEVLTKGDAAVISDLKEISAIGHRVVQGAEKFSQSVLITDEVLQAIIDVADLAPLHNPAHVLAIRACQKVFDACVPQVAVFDTAFHQTMPKKAYIFGIPYEYYEKYHIRRYGFHGTSHRYVSARYAKITGNKLQGRKVITCHLGNGSSIAAIKDGKCVDTSMGLTPLDGFIMGSRSGGIDPSVITFLQEKEGWSPKETSDVLNKQSGFLGISGVSSDSRDVTAAAEAGNERAKLTLEIVWYQITKFIGSYAAAMGGVDTIIFTGGIGENVATLRREVCSNLEYMGVKFDDAANNQFNSTEHIISAKDSKVDVWIIPTNEELLIARDTKELVEG